MLPSGELQFVGQFNSDMAMLLPGSFAEPLFFSSFPVIDGLLTTIGA